MDLHTWLTFVAATCVIAISPGSGAVLSMSHGLSFGVRKASATIVGLQLGLLLILLVAGAGVGSLLLASEVVAAPGAAVSAATGADAGSWQKRCATGFLTNATNPKGIIFMVAVLPQFISPERPLALQLAIVSATMVTIDLVVMHSYAASASALRRLLSSPRALRGQNRVFGGLLMAVGAGLFFVQRGAQAVK